MSVKSTEHAKAVQEVAKTSGQAIGVVEKIGKWCARVMGEPIDAAVGMLADKFRFMRWERQVLLVDKAEEIIRRRGHEAKMRCIPPKFLLTVFENASLEEDDDIHMMYSRLLAATTDPDVEQPRVAFAEILRQLEPLDAKVLQAMYHSGWNICPSWQTRPAWYLHGVSVEHLNRCIPDVGKETWPVVAGNLRRLGLIEHIPVDSSQIPEWSLSLSPLGFQFMRACVYDGEPFTQQQEDSR